MMRSPGLEETSAVVVESGMIIIIIIIGNINREGKIIMELGNITQ